VTTKLLGRIAEEAGQSFVIDDLLVGFKYVADVLKRLGRNEAYRGIRCKPEDLVLAAEESHGVIVKSSILDKDAAPACLYLADLHVRLSERNENLLDYYVRILERFGAYDSVNRSIVMTGSEGIARKDRIMGSLRKQPPTEFLGFPVTRVADYWNEREFGPFVSETDRTPRNVLQFFTDAVVVTVRPSGTEPKLKLYCQLLPGAGATDKTGRALLDHVRTQADEVARRVYGLLLERIGFSLGKLGLLLPDVVDLDLKLEFEKTTIPELRRALETGDLAALPDVLAWLGTSTQAMTPGTSPLPALRAPLLELCRMLGGEPSLAANHPQRKLLSELETWARQ
jgi:hypothetical protein